MKKKKLLLGVLLVSVVLVVLAYFDLAKSPDLVKKEVGDSAEIETTNEWLGQSPAYAVEQVVDGDTLLVTIDGVKESVRVLGINTPETELSSSGAECFGAEASNYARTLLSGASVLLASDNSQDSRDKYGRLLAYVTLPDGRDFGEVMITEGYAHEYTFKGRAYQKQTLYKTAEVKAKENKAGLWADGACDE